MFPDFPPFLCGKDSYQKVSLIYAPQTFSFLMYIVEHIPL